MSKNQLQVECEPQWDDSMLSCTWARFKFHPRHSLLMLKTNPLTDFLRFEKKQKKKAF